MESRGAEELPVSCCLGREQGLSPSVWTAGPWPAGCAPGLPASSSLSPHTTLSPSDPNHTECTRCIPRCIRGSHLAAVQDGAGEGLHRGSTHTSSSHLQPRVSEAASRSPGLERSILPGLSLGASSGSLASSEVSIFLGKRNRTSGLCFHLRGDAAAARGAGRLYRLHQQEKGRTRSVGSPAEFMFERCRPP